MEIKRLALYVTLLGDSGTVEWYAVESSDGEPSALWNDGFCSTSKTPLDVSSSLREWLMTRKAE